MSSNTAQEEAFQTELERAKQQDLERLRNSHAVYVMRDNNGDHITDCDANKVVVLIPSLIPSDEPDSLEKAFALFLCETEHIRHTNYRVLYIHCGLQPSARLLWWLIRHRQRLSYPHRKNLAALTVIHPSLSARILFAALTPVVGGNFWRKLHYADRVEEVWLDGVLRKQDVQAGLPQIVSGYETKLEREAADMRDLTAAMGVRFK